MFWSYSNHVLLVQGAVARELESYYYLQPLREYVMKEYHVKSVM